jgi:hypothetical protein
VLKGIVFDRDLADVYTLDLTARAAENPDEIQFDTLIWSQPGSGLPRYHYRARVTLQQGIQMGPISKMRKDDGQATLSGRELYHDGTLFHGLSFQGIEQILTIDASGLTMRASLPPMPREDQGQFGVQTFNPFLVDVQLQSLLVWAKRFVGQGGLPLRIAQGTQYRPMPFGEAMLTSMHVQSQSSLSLVADVEMWDGAGSLCMEVKGAEITLSARLNELFLCNRLDVTDFGAPVSA